MSLTTEVNQIYKALRYDEQLLRLLHYDNHPLDKDKENITSKPVEELEKISTECVKLGEKESELTDEKVRRVFIETGRRRIVFGKPFYAKQIVNISVIVHESFVSGFRLEQISTRINQILLHNNISGVSKIYYEGGDPRGAPREFQGYIHRYSFMVTNKEWC